MAEKRVKRETTARISVADASGRRRTVEEVTDFMRQQFHDNTWTDWMVTTRRYFCDGEQVNKTSGTEFQFPASGEVLTRS